MPEIIEVAIEGAFRRQQKASVADHIGVCKVGDHPIRYVVEKRLLGMRIACFKTERSPRAMLLHPM